MIYYNLNTINDWNFGDDNIIKVYKHGAVCYYKITVGGGQVPCYAVVDDISQYSDTEFEDVFNKADGKWYKLNNLTQYEEYGVYGTGRNITTYEGKLTIDGDYEYIYSGSSWENVGEVSGSTATLPNVPFSLNYNAKKYDTSTNKIPQTSGQLQNVDAVRTYGNGVVDHSADGYISVTGNTRFVCSGNSGTYLNRRNTQAECTMTIVSKAKTTSGYSILTNRQGNGTTHLNWMYRQYAEGYMKLHGQSADLQIDCSTTEPNILVARTYYDNGVKYYLNNWSSGTTSSISSFAYLNTGSTGGALFCDYSDINTEFWQGDFYWVYMSQNVLTDEQIQQVIDYNESSGGEPEYPMYYDEMQDPPDNLSFSSITEAEEYECPWVGMIATIDGVKYVFSGDSQTGYEWVLKPSRLPDGYTEVEYIRNSNYNAYINTGVIPFDNRNNTYTITVRLTSQFHSNLSCATIINCEYPVSPYNGLGYRYKCSSTVDELEFFGGNPNYSSSVVDNGDGTKTVSFQSTGATTFTNNAPLSLCCGFSSTSFTTPNRFADATIYSATIVKNGVTVRDYVPAKRDSDSVYGLYDLINDVFYVSPNGNNFSGGEPV